MSQAPQVKNDPEAPTEEPDASPATADAAKVKEPSGDAPPSATDKPAADKPVTADKPKEAAAPTAAELPYGVPVPGKKGFVYSPYDKSAGFVDVRDIGPGTKVRCPYTGKIFRVP